MHEIKLFYQTHSIDDIYTTIDNISLNELMVLCDFEEEILYIDEYEELEDDIEASYEFLEPIFQNPWRIDYPIDDKYIELRGKEFKMAVNQLLRTTAIELEDSSLLEALNDKMYDQFNKLIVKLEKKEILSEEEKNDFELSFTYRVRLLALQRLALIDIELFKISNSGHAYFHTLSSEKSIKQIRILKSEIELKESKMQSNLINIAGLMIALFSIIGFNVYSIDGSLDIKTTVLMNVSIMCSISLIFFLIDFTKSNSENSWRLLPLVILMILVLFLSICLLI